MPDLSSKPLSSILRDFYLSDIQDQNNRELRIANVAELIRRAELAESAPIAQPEAPEAPEAPGTDGIEAIAASVLSVCPTRHGGAHVYGNVSLHGGAQAYGNVSLYGQGAWKDTWHITSGQLVLDTLLQGVAVDGDLVNAYTQTTLLTMPVQGVYKYLDGVAFEHFAIERNRRWGARLHGLRSDVAFIDGVVRDIQDEHGLYLSLCGMNGGDTGGHLVIFEDMAFINCQGQATQLVQRDKFKSPNPNTDYSHETPDMAADMTAGKDIVYRRVSAFNVSQPGTGRASFNHSLFAARSHVRMDDMLIDNWLQSSSRGFLLVEGYAGTGDPYKRSATLNRFFFRSAKSPQQAMLFDGCASVSLSTGVIDVPPGSNARIDINGADEWSVKNVHSINAPIWVFIDGVKHKTVDQISASA